MKVILGYDLQHSLILPVTGRPVERISFDFENCATGGSCITYQCSPDEHCGGNMNYYGIGSQKDKILRQSTAGPPHVLKHCPPLALTTLPVIQADSGLHTIATIPAISSTYAGLPPHLFATAFISSVSHSLAPVSGMRGLHSACAASTSSLQFLNISVITEPGFTVFTVACSASSRAQVRVMASRAPLVPL